MAPAEQPKYLGITDPISVSPPTEAEEAATIAMMEELHRQGVFESAEDSKRREVALDRISALTKKFVQKVTIARGLSEVTARNAGGKVYTFGSYRLGVHTPESDIDTLCVVPKHVSREDFFDVFEPMLRESPDVTEVAGIPEAYVPIIKIKMFGIPIDILMARLALSSIPEDLSLQDSNILRNLDDRCVRSLNGYRVTDELLRLVPNVDVFRDALRCIKLWAQRKAIYSNVNGFPGGVAWAMLVARVCQLYPNANAGTVVGRFFPIMHQWPWPAPVILKHVDDLQMGQRSWNPKASQLYARRLNLFPGDRAHRMPVITPVYPAMCATHNVSVSTFAIIEEELRRGTKLMNSIILGSSKWSELFEKHDFFHKYRYFLQIIASTASAEAQLMWAPNVEAKIRQLVSKLELVESLTLAHPFTKGFEQVFYCINDDEIRSVAQGEVPDIIARRRPQDIEGVESGSKVYSTTFYIGLAIEPRPVGAIGTRRLDISYPTTEFTKVAKMWERFDEATMGLVVRHIKSSALPDYVFEPGERQPRSAQKRVKGPGKSNDPSPDVPNKKRRSSYPVNENSYPANGEHSYATNGERSYTNGNGQPHGNGHLSTNGQFSSNGQHYPMNHHVPSVTDHLPLKTSDNGVSPIVLTPVSESGPYPTKDIPEVRTPQLPFGENVKLAAGITP
ncbi:Poly(A) polymerase [Schizophyllum commune Loenen D]|nr:Poly(A) polymerase [Schizophyllum commune Loenen D]